MILGISLKKFSAASPRVLLIQGFSTHHFPGQFFFFFSLKNILATHPNEELALFNGQRAGLMITEAWVRTPQCARRLKSNFFLKKT